jgi:PAS domain S-box-containing protein
MTADQQRVEVVRLVGYLALAGVLVFLGAISIANRFAYEEHTDGVTWESRDGVLVAAAVQPEGSGARAGLVPGDRVVRVGGSSAISGSILTPEFVEAVLWERPVGTRLEYEVQRGSGTETLLVRVAGVPVPTRTYFYLVLVGTSFLVAGLFALLRQREGSAGHRFFWLAMAFYTVLVLTPTRPGDPLFSAIFWADDIARNLLPGLFLYFALTFPQPKPQYLKNRTAWLVGAFGPGVVLTFLNLTVTLADTSLPMSSTMRYAILRVVSNLGLFYIAGALGLGVLLLAHSYKEATSPLERKRLQWLIGGTAIGVFPFVVIYVPLFVFNITQSRLIDLAVLPLLLVPISFGYAAVSFRLWDVEVILKRALAYALAALAVLGVYLGAEWALQRVLGGIDPQLVQAGALIATLLVAFAFAPLRDKFQEWLDRLHYRERYRSRRGLVDFGRQLNTELNLNQVVDLLIQRVRDMVAVGRVAVLHKPEGGTCLQLVPAVPDAGDGPQLSESFSDFLGSALMSREFLFIDDMSALLDEFPEDREILAVEDLAYFLPLMVKGEVLGVLALGRTISGDYLSSEDLRILEMLCSHAALALDNAVLYQQAEKRAREFERLKNYSENIIESIKVGVMVLDGEGFVRSWNRSMESLHGLSMANAVGRQIDDVFPKSFVASLERARRRVQTGDEPLASAYRVVTRTNDGRDRIVNISAAPLLGEEGAYGSVVMVDDVTDQTELESQLRQSDRLASVGLLAAGVAHEVNTPLAGISGYVQMLQRKIPKSDPRHPILEKIEKQTFRASRIVNNLLNFSRQQPSEMQALDVNDLVSETLALAELPLSKRNVRVETDLAETLPPVWGDPGKLQQVLMNLVLNARDSMPNGGDLRIHTARHNGEVVVEVADTGAGIAAEEINKIYDPFFTTKGTSKGTGLGLSVSYGIIQEHRGTITVRSEPGNGTCFRVALPLAEASRSMVAS